MLTKKSRKDPILMEARRVLLNQVELDEDGFFVVPEERRIPLWGAADGENRIRTLGISKRSYSYVANRNSTQAVYKAGKVIESIGRGIHLHSLEEAAACLSKSYIFYPVVLVFYEDEDGMLKLWK